MRVLDETDLLLDLLREAGDEPVTLDELEIVGVHDPAAALLALELAGHHVHRVIENPRPGRPVTCVRLGDAPAAAPAPTPLPPRPASVAPAPPQRARASAPPDRSRLLAAALLGALIVLLLGATRRAG